ncbi:adenylylsulfate reductase subunit alpha [Poriferisphaera corsica]|uniref:Adenylylsulfate reductase subunit alpha n=1 Tax=Poriferisphaera corsica TaxID=2528020 RepID=A0A517YV99_9BACT|nr:aminoacetone oxidase family FAD-binding enzyme [Poriferisphaera corsica]QDU34092.1 adenylylsulfate reductase subunit alpha [Poriferisphaera corsica]
MTHINKPISSLTSPDVLIIGAGAAGLFAAIHTARINPNLNILILDSAKQVGTKILVSGGSRCNVTHHKVSPKDYAGASKNQINKILKSYTIKQTINFFEQIGISLKQEPTGKMFPTTDSARDVLNALLSECSRLGITILTNHKVSSIQPLHSRPPSSPQFEVRTENTHQFTPRTIILATGGRSLPKSGSDGSGYTLAQALGHTITNTTPALVPLTFPKGHYLTSLSGLSFDTTLTLSASTGKTIHQHSASLLLTHFGLSGPAAMDISRHFIAATQNDPHAKLTASLISDQSNHSFESLEQQLIAAAKQSPTSHLINHITKNYLAHIPGSSKLLTAIFSHHLNIDPTTPLAQLSRDHRRSLIHTLLALPLNVTGNRGWNYAEVTAGGIPLTEINLKSMSSRHTPNLHLIGEILNVDGRIGGFNFQFAWSTAYIAAQAISASID